MRKRELYNFLVFSFLVLMLTACGYEPSSHVVKKTFDDNIYVEVKVDRAEPENAPFVKDEINRLVYTRFKGRVTSKEQQEVPYSSHTQEQHLLLWHRKMDM